jgi:hypothetical protein
MADAKIYGVPRVVAQLRKHLIKDGKLYDPAGHNPLMMLAADLLDDMYDDCVQLDADAADLAKRLRVFHGSKEHVEAADKIERLSNGCNAMLGLVKMLLNRDDLPPEVRAVLETNHRVEEARNAIKRAEGR